MSLRTERTTPTTSRHVPWGQRVHGDRGDAGSAGGPTTYGGGLGVSLLMLRHPWDGYLGENPRLSEGDV